MISSLFQKIITILFLVFFACTFLWEVPFQNPLLRYALYTGAVPNTVLFLIGAGCLVILFLIGKKYRAPLEKFLEEKNRILLPVFLLVLLAVSLFFVYHGSFYPGWDAGIVYEQALNTAKGISSDFYTVYYSNYPNNALMTWIFAMLEKIWMVWRGHDSPFILAAFQSLLGILTGFLLFQTARRMKQSYLTSWAVLLVYGFFVQLSPWMLVPYSDGTVLIVPTFILYLYICSRETQNRRSKLLIWVLIGLFTGIGYSIKPQAVFITIAIVLNELFQIRGMSGLFHFVKKIIVTGLGAGVVLLMVSHLILPSLGMNLDPDQKIGMPHFLMMGMNETNNGIYSQEDYEFSTSFQTVEERNEADLKRARERIDQMGWKGTLSLMARKNAMNYSDGSFAWYEEGDFVRKEYAEGKTTDAINRWLRPDGGKFRGFLASRQFVWLLLLAGCAVMIPASAKEERKDPVLLVMKITLLGLSLFEMIFEARARYLFLYAPYYILIGVMGLRNLFRRFQR
jgi:hypothetical protein